MLPRCSYSNKTKGLQRIAQRIEQLLINKYAIYGTFAIWAIIKAIAPVTHINTLEPYITVMPGNVFNAIIYLPMIMFLCLLIYRMIGEKDKGIKSKNIIDPNLYLIFGYMFLVAVTALQIYSMTTMQVAAHGSLVTWGMLMSLSMAIVYKLRSTTGITAVLISLMAVFWVIGFYETPYQICRYYFSDYNLILTIESLEKIVIREVLLFVPFIVALIVFKIKCTKSSIIFMGAFLALWIIWLVPGHFQTLYIIDTSLSTTRSLMNNPIDWTWYHIGKTCKVFLALAVLLLDYKNLAVDKGEK